MLAIRYKMPWSMLAMNRTAGGEWDRQRIVCSNNQTLFGIAHGCPDGSAVPDG